MQYWFRTRRTITCIWAKFLRYIWVDVSAAGIITVVLAALVVLGALRRLM